MTGDGIATTSLEFEPVRFWDQDSDGDSDESGWLAADDDDAFVWLDLTADGRVQPRELFGSAMFRSDGTLFRNGFQALEVFDAVAAGGNGDGVIDRADAVWPHLLLWTDRNHDAISQADEIATVDAAGVLSLGLARVHDHSIEAAGNSMMLVGSFTMTIAKQKRIEKEKEVKPKEIGERLLADVSFAYGPT